MMNKVFFCCLSLLFLTVSCNSNESKKTEKKSNKNELVVRKGKEFTEFYPDKIHVKMHGFFDENGERHGVWEYFTQDGIKLSLTMYLHGVKDGISVVFYPNGAQRYSGEYKNDKKVGEWKFYDNKGNLVQSKTY